MKNGLKILAASFAIAMAATPAEAAVKIATFSGTIYAGFDDTGVFGAAGQNLAGLSYVSTFTYDRRRGGTQGGSGGSDYSYGGVDAGNSSPILDSTVTINGVTIHLSGAYQGSAGILAYEPPDIPVFHYMATDFNYDDETYYWATLVSYGHGTYSSTLDENVLPTTIHTPEGSVSIEQRSQTTGIRSMYAAANFYLGDAVYSVSDGPSSAVPEPGSWALMLIGFGLTGATLRCRNTPNLAPLAALSLSGTAKRNGANGVDFELNFHHALAGPG